MESAEMAAAAGPEIDLGYEFSAPQYFNFLDGESKTDLRKAESWFESGISYAPSPFISRMKASVSEVLSCQHTVVNDLEQGLGPSTKPTDCASTFEGRCLSLAMEYDTIEKQTDTPLIHQALQDKHQVKEINGEAKLMCMESNKRDPSFSTTEQIPTVKDTPRSVQACTPKMRIISIKDDKPTTNMKNSTTAKKAVSAIRNSSSLSPVNQNRSVLRDKHSKSTTNRNMLNLSGHVNLAQENQAIKRQKLSGGRSRQILNVKPLMFPHKLRTGVTVTGGIISTPQASSVKRLKEGRKVYARELTVPFVSMGELIQKFQSSTRDLPLPHSNAANIQRTHKLTLTCPKEPGLETAHPMRPTTAKSTAELEEEMMAKLSNFKARPLNKKILEAPCLPALRRSTPHIPQFQEFHFKTMGRAKEHAEASSRHSTNHSSQNCERKSHLVDQKSPFLQTALLARPTQAKSSMELEIEELQRIPKFKAKPFNKKIFESKGEVRMFCATKKHVTIPREFHFATDERLPPPYSVADLFDKLSLSSEPRHESKPPKLTAPNPFHLHTEERGAEKERKFQMEMMQKHVEEERARIPKSNPYPYSTDYPVIPRKPEPKPCTRPQPFQLESLVRHEKELLKEMEERQRLEREEARKRIFKAQTILKDDPIPLPAKVRLPLTEVEEFNLWADHRAVERAEFDEKVKEKEILYKRYREEKEAIRMMEEEKALKHMRRTVMVPQARPLPDFNRPFCPRRSHKNTTRPKPPHLRILERIERRKHGVMMAATSSPAANMR